jgi:hypothetical protein
MCRKLSFFASIVVLIGLLSPLAVAQTFRYDFDGRADPGPGDFDEDGDTDGRDFLIWQLTVPLSVPDLNDWKDHYGTTTTPADPTDWMTSENWREDGFDPLFPLLPDFDTRVEIEDSKYGDNAPVIGPGDAAEAYGVRIGRTGGEGLLTMTGGTLDIADTCGAPFFNCNRRLRVGNADVIDPIDRNPGTFNLSDGVVSTDTLWIGSGSQGTMNMSGGVVNTRGTFYLDWTFDASSVLNMTGGTINVGTVTLLSSPLRLYRTSSLNLDGGEILVAGSAELGTETGLNPDFLQAPNVTVSITDGLLQAGSFLQIGGSIVLDGGILRADSFNESLSAGTVDINGNGLLQFNNTQESVAAVEALITSGFFTTSEASTLAVDVVDVGGIDFTQVSVSPALLVAGAVTIPEPSSVALALLASIGVVFARGNFFAGNRKRIDCENYL